MARSDDQGRDGLQADPGHDELAALLAKEAIREALYAELDAWRRRDWAAMRTGFAPAARIEGTLFGASSAARPSLSAGDALARLADAMKAHAASSLVVSNCRIGLAPDGARAHVASLILAAHEPNVERGERTRLEALHYEDEWIEESSEGAGRLWRVAARRVELLWQAWLDPRRDDRAGDHRHAEEWTR